MVIAHEQLFQFTKSVLIAAGCPEKEARLAAEVLLSADLRGVDSHGVARLKGYIRLMDKGRVNTKPETKVIHETPSTAVLDGDAGLGLVVGPEAMRLAIDKAKQVGTGWVSVRNSNHFGIAGYHSMLALKDDCIGISMTNASPLVAPTFSKERLLGTNPIAVAIPADKEPPFVLDMATTTAANGKLEVLQRKKAEAPSGWVQDADGNPTVDPLGVKNGGALLPLGGDREHGSHKGYGLSSVVDIFSAVLSGANYGPWVPPFVAFMEPAADPVGKGIGHFFGAMRIDAFRPGGEFKSHMDNWISRFRNAEPVIKGHDVLIPGDPERKLEQKYRTEGVPLLDPVVEDLKELGSRFEVNFPT
ncbi:Ldh family oxidoreductase [Marinoscillum furvescens]|uniref:Malate dehydrogenase (NAD) n=1 Tax=Marinoscillum furvescens DSM 4134 TaxID=1122208 RepID=A0A3D9L349_MARFU|nr:Ldh family oxidoreductase [Marinoscillum furvescens]RED99463.1 malate dehydrogenase (NAD) [Marinoscillum furvescens DSM 4134]